MTKGALDGVKEDGAGVMGRYCGRTGKWGESRDNGRAMDAVRAPSRQAGRPDPETTDPKRAARGRAEPAEHSS